MYEELRKLFKDLSRVVRSLEVDPDVKRAQAFRRLTNPREKFGNGRHQRALTGKCRKGRCRRAVRQIGFKPRSHHGKN